MKKHLLSRRTVLFQLCLSSRLSRQRAHYLEPDDAWQDVGVRHQTLDITLESFFSSVFALRHSDSGISRCHWLAGRIVQASLRVDISLQAL